MVQYCPLVMFATTHDYSKAIFNDLIYYIIGISNKTDTYIEYEYVFCTYILIKYLTMHFGITLFDKLSITHHTKKNFAFSHSRYILYPGRGWLWLEIQLKNLYKRNFQLYKKRWASQTAADSCGKKAVKFRICGKVPWQRWLCSVQRWRLQLQWLWLPKLLRSTCREENQGHQEKDQCY